MAKDKKKLEQEAEGVIKLFREQVKGVAITDKDFATEYEKETDPTKFRDFCYYCTKVVSSPFFPLIVNQLVQNQVWFIGLEAEGDPQVFFGRGSVNGVRVMEEYFRKYATEWETRFAGQEDQVNSHKMFEPTEDLDEEE